MNPERLIERRKWFRVFPEGTLEFAVITRVLVLILLMALAAVGGTQRPLVVLCILAVLWIDYALVMWWLVQVATDLAGIAGDPISSRSSPVTAMAAILPSVAAVLALCPWAKVAEALFGHGTGWINLLQPIGAVAFLILLVPGYRALAGIRLGSPPWTVLSLVPVLHWFATHRLAAGLNRRIDAELRARGQERASRGPGASLPIADVTWAMSVLCWGAVLVYALARGWPTSTAFKILPVGSTIIAAFFAIANLATLEAVQRQIVTLIRKASA